MFSGVPSHFLDQRMVLIKPRQSLLTESFLHEGDPLTNPLASHTTTSLGPNRDFYLNLAANLAAITSTW